MIAGVDWEAFGVSNCRAVPQCVVCELDARRVVELLPSDGALRSRMSSEMSNQASKIWAPWALFVPGGHTVDNIFGAPPRLRPTKVDNVLTPPCPSRDHAFWKSHDGV